MKRIKILLRDRARWVLKRDWVICPTRPFITSSCRQVPSSRCTEHHTATIQQKVSPSSCPFLSPLLGDRVARPRPFPARPNLPSPYRLQHGNHRELIRESLTSRVRSCLTENRAAFIRLRLLTDHPTTWIFCIVFIQNLRGLNLSDVKNLFCFVFALTIIVLSLVQWIGNKI